MRKLLQWKWMLCIYREQDLNVKGYEEIPKRILQYSCHNPGWTYSIIKAQSERLLLRHVHGPTPLSPQCQRLKTAVYSESHLSERNVLQATRCNLHSSLFTFLSKRTSLASLLSRMFWAFAIRLVSSLWADSDLLTSLPCSLLSEIVINERL